MFNCVNTQISWVKVIPATANPDEVDWVLATFTPSDYVGFDWTLSNQAGLDHGNSAKLLPQLTNDKPISIRAGKMGISISCLSPQEDQAGEVFCKEVTQPIGLPIAAQGSLQTGGDAKLKALLEEPGTRSVTATSLAQKTVELFSRPISSVHMKAWHNFQDLTDAATTVALVYALGQHEQPYSQYLLGFPRTAKAQTYRLTIKSQMFCKYAAGSLLAQHAVAPPNDAAARGMEHAANQGLMINPAFG